MSRFPDLSFKIVLVGDSGVGKSNIISRFTKNQFNISQKTTIGVEFATKTIDINGTIVKLQIWDTAGEERYKSVASAYYRGSSGALMVYDITRASSFESLGRWKKQLSTYASEDIVCLLMGNKSDKHNDRCVTREHGQNFAKEHHMAFLETSALDGSNIDEAFQQMIEQLVSRSKIKPDFKDKVMSIKKQSFEISKPENNSTKTSQSCCN